MELRLLPLPKQINMGNGSYALPSTGQIIIQTETAAEQLYTAKRLQTALKTHANADYDIAAGPFDEAIVLTIDEETQPEQGYELVIADDGVTVIGGDALVTAPRPGSPGAVPR